MITNHSELVLRRRGDLEIFPQQSGARQFWVVKDPIALRYFKLCQEEFAILEWLDTHVTLDQITNRFNERFAPRQLTPVRLQSFLAHLYRYGLLVSDGPGQAEQLLARYHRQRYEALWSAYSNILAVRFRGIDPDKALAWLYPKLRWLFSVPFLGTTSLVIVSALALVIIHREDIWHRFPDFREFVTPANLVWLAVVLSVTKVLHELGHALTCKHFGGECHEIGVMLLVFAPCLYCNVTDSWVLRSRWQRIAISAAGIAVELLLAAICTFAWWYSRPGFFHTTCFNVMAVCAVGTVLLNGNPLLRYDGYFILSDLLNIPNLWQESRSAVHGWLGRLMLGIMPRHASIRDENRLLLLAFGAASMVYRALVVVAILCFIYSVLLPARLGTLAHLVTATVLVGLLLGPIWKVMRFVEEPYFSQRVKWSRIAMVCLAVLGGGVLFFRVPLSYRLSAPVMLEPRVSANVFIPVAGTLVDAVRPGQQVAEGDVLARLENPELRAEVTALEGEYSQALIKVRSLESLRADYTEVGAQLPAARERLADMRERLAKKRREQQALTIRAPSSGTVLPPPRRPKSKANRTHLDPWSGTPLDLHNQGCALEIGTLFCVVGDPDQHQAVLFMDESQIPFVQPEQQVRMAFDIAPSIVLTGIVVEVARTDVQVVPRELAGEQDVANRPDPAGVPRPLMTSYQARVELNSHRCKLLNGARGRARIAVEPQTLYERLLRLIRNTFAGIATAD